ncbi:MAG: glycosyltransferase [Lachnospiraceae bacterium]|nr:glycosyltransferase [Lachnospiraceae bacterium]
MVGDRKRIVAMAPYERPWSNVELVKDCGLIPYLLYKNHNCDVSMVGAKGETYPYLEAYLHGMKMELLPDGKTESKLAYISEHARETDALLLRGCYPNNFPIAYRYKECNPDGKIYVGLDANSSWMDRINFRDAAFAQFMDCCDVLATSCYAMQEMLNRKWPWRIEHIPNGYYPFDRGIDQPDYEKKENIILTVSRLGTQQKNTELLLEAFALAADKIPGWNLRLVGNIEKSFYPYRDLFLEKHPGLADRVCFVGPLLDREALFGEYRKAKVFALSSVMEGGTPNVISEALISGCVPVTTKVDAYEEITDRETLGFSSEIGDVQSFAENLIKVCHCENLQQLSEKAYEYGRNHFDMECITEKVYELLFEV